MCSIQRFHAAAFVRAFSYRALLRAHTLKSSPHVRPRQNLRCTRGGDNTRRAAALPCSTTPHTPHRKSPPLALLALLAVLVGPLCPRFTPHPPHTDTKIIRALTADRNQQIESRGRGRGRANPHELQGAQGLGLRCALRGGRRAGRCWRQGRARGAGWGFPAADLGERLGSEALGHVQATWRFSQVRGHAVGLRGEMWATCTRGVKKKGKKQEKKPKRF